MRTFHGLEELAAAVGTELGVSDWHTVTQEQVDRFADATDDHQWIHVDPQRAAAGPFGTTIAHGYLTLSLVPLFASGVYAIEGVRMAVNYGCNKVRFPAPVPVGSRLRGVVTLDSVSPNGPGFLVAATVTVQIEGSAKPACVAETLVLVVP
jgi:acyl dehydratase